MAALRDPATGCPWDREQDFATIAPYTIEEAYEVADAIDRGSLDELAGELGDLLFQVVFHARLAEEAGAFDFGDVVERICAKMRRRHPHVFGDAVIATAAEQTQAWEQLKEQERARRDERARRCAGRTAGADPRGQARAARRRRRFRLAGCRQRSAKLSEETRRARRRPCNRGSRESRGGDRRRAAHTGEPVPASRDRSRKHAYGAQPHASRHDSGASKSAFKRSAVTGVPTTSMRSRRCGSKPKPSVDAHSGSIHGPPRNVRSKIRKDRQRKESVMWGKSFVVAVLMFGVAGVAGASHGDDYRRGHGHGVWASRIDRVHLCACRRCRSR